MGKHKQPFGITHHLVMGGGQHQCKKLCIWGLSLLIPFLVLFCIFPSGSSVHRPPGDRIVVSQLQVPPLHAARSDVTTLSSDDAIDVEAEDEETRVSILDEPDAIDVEAEDEEPHVSFLDEPDFKPKKEKRHRGGKKLKRQNMSMKSLRKRARKRRRKKGSDNPIITPLMEKEHQQSNAEDIQPETSSMNQKIDHDEETISDTAIEEETSSSGKTAASQDDEAAMEAKARLGRRKLHKEEGEEKFSPLGKELESNEEDPTSPNSSSFKSKQKISSSGKEFRADEEDPASPEESNVAVAEDAVFFVDMEKTDDSKADAESKVSFAREKKTSKVNESSTQSGKMVSEQAGNGRATDLLFWDNTDEEVIPPQSPEGLVAEDDRAGGEDFFLKQSGKCRYYRGKWIINSTELSKDSTCTLMSINDQQTCALERNEMKPSKWRWQPSDCKVEHFKANTFLNMMQRKSLAFVGDKLAKAHMESLLCLLAEVEKPSLIYEDKTNKSSAWHFSSSNFTISMLWSPHLVQEIYENGYKKLHLDRLDTTWGVMVPRIDVLILGVGSRFIEPAIYTVHNEVVGCSSCKDLIGQNGFANMKEMSLYSGFRAIMRSALMGVGALPGFEGITLFLQPYGFEGNSSYHSVSIKMKDIQEEELHQAYKRGSISNQSKMEVLHTDFISMSKKDNMQGPIISTCLVPGPLTNTWNKFLQHTLTRLLVS